ncbi:YodC family protein [Rufibacter sp. XAAS-G3-1]|uniref:YodC family protein n=1 Tax=Rufibacter sp. XAAS-G3-1 TaxID=2729134 RepID=UPI0015E6EE84|nr:DUF2158 domain-containing protein [Rufibacter sp. XAAS-G3-1]
MDFNIGDVVELKSGGPKMTIQKIVGKSTDKMENFALKTAGHSDGDLVCQWFINNKLETNIFKPETLKKI